MSKQWIFHDESWDSVVNRWEYRRRLLMGGNVPVADEGQILTREVQFSGDGTIVFSSDRKKSDKWLYLNLDPTRHSWSNYRWNFKFQRNSTFREFQFGFRYQDFYSRYRYRFERDRLYFDQVINGQFYPNFSSCPFPIEAGRWYDVRIDVIGNHFRCYVDSVLKLSDYDFMNRFVRGSIAIILWEDVGNSLIKAAVSDISVFSLKPNA